MDRRRNERVVRVDVLHGSITLEFGGASCEQGTNSLYPESGKRMIHIDNRSDERDDYLFSPVLVSIYDRNLMTMHVLTVTRKFCDARIKDRWTKLNRY